MPTAFGSRAARVVSSPHAGDVEHAEKWRGWVERAGASVRAPMWTSREGWLTAVSTWAHTPGFAACCEAARVSLSSSTVMAVARVMAAHADHASGRHCAVTRARIAEAVGCDVQTVTRVWRVLRAAGWAVEAQRGHGSPDTPAVGRRPSVYHLVSRRLIAPVVDNAYLPAKPGSCLSTPVGSNSPRARERAGKMTSPPKRHRRWRAEPAPRPLLVQRLAAQLVRDCHGLDRGHLGAVCDALTAAGIDPAVWSATAIRARLDADMRARGSSWPDRIERPAAFLAARLRRLDWQQLDEPTRGGCAAARPDKPAEPRPVTRSPATPEQRAAHRAAIAATLTAGRRARAAVDQRSEFQRLVEHDPIHTTGHGRVTVHEPVQRSDRQRRVLGDQRQQQRRLEIHAPR